MKNQQVEINFHPPPVEHVLVVPRQVELFYKFEGIQIVIKL